MHMVIPDSSRLSRKVLGETERIQHVLCRFSFGPAPGLVDEIRQTGLSEWFDAQLSTMAEEGSFLKARLADLHSIGMTNQEVIREYRNNDPKQRRRRLVPAEELKEAIVLRAVYGNNHILEVACDFFRNHFNVDTNKNNLRYLVTEYEREVIRAHSLGSFREMLMASAKHPAMLVYLDNVLSRKPPSKQELREIGRRVKRKTGSKARALESVEIARQRGLNENYARELLELHTLGVDNDYTQRDIIEVAKVLTGWTVQNNPDEPVTFKFRPEMHVPGDKRVLRGVIQADRDNPVAEGEGVIRKLLRHPGTARFLSFKLCRYLVSDDPPERMVKRVAQVFGQAKGELPTVYRAIFDDPEFFSPAHFQSKFKRPFEFLISALRATGAEVFETRVLQRILKELNEPLYECEDPTGYYDQAEAWNDPGVMARRWRFAMDLVHGRIKGVTIPASFYDGLHKPIPMAWKNQLARRVLSSRMSKRTSDVIDKMLRKKLDETEQVRLLELAPLVLGMLLGSPEFQRQ